MEENYQLDPFGQDPFVDDPYGGFDIGEQDPNQTGQAQQQQDWAYGDPLSGYDADKWYNLEHDSPKYQIGRLLTGYDPTQGITDDLLSALNALGIGDFTKEAGDKVRVTNGDPRFEGDALLDLITGYNTGNGSWGYQVAEGAGANPDPLGSYGQGGAGGGAGGGPIPLGGSYFGGGAAGGGQMIDGQLNPNTSSAYNPAYQSGGEWLSQVLAMLTGNEEFNLTDVDLDPTIQGLLSGDLNQDIIDRRVNAARDDLERARSSEMGTLNAQLADLGQLGSGAGTTAHQRYSEDLFNQLNTNINQIYADQSELADSRMMGALNAGTQLTIAEIQQLMNAVGAANTRDLGFANVDLGYSNLDLAKILGLGDLALGNATLGAQNQQFYADLALRASQGDQQAVVDLIRIIFGGGQTVAGGQSA